MCATNQMTKHKNHYHYLKTISKNKQKKTWFYFISIFLNLEEKNKQTKKKYLCMIGVSNYPHTHTYIDQLIQSDQQVFFVDSEKINIPLSYLFFGYNW